MAGDSEETETQKQVAAIEQAVLADEVEKVAPADGKGRRKLKPAPAREPTA